MKARRSPAELAAWWAALPVRIDDIKVERRAVRLADYPGGQRPSSTIFLSSAGHTGCGENVAFTAEEHEAFGARAPRLLAGARAPETARGEAIQPAPGARWARGSVAWWMEAMTMDGESNLSLYERAALEAALIDLAMRQVGITLGDVAGVAERPLHTVVSFAACPDPRQQIQRLRQRGYGGAFKVDVDPGWNSSACEALAKAGGVRILDFKGRGSVSLADELSRLFPDAIFEDPPRQTVHPSISRDMEIADAGAAAAAHGRGEAVNVKAPRMGGPLQLLQALDIALRPGAIGGGAHALAGRAPGPSSSSRLGVAAYFGGMFEVGVGRAQARQLAALFCGDAPNDLALNLEVPAEGGAPASARRGMGDAPVTQVTAPAPIAIRLDRPGFGAL